MPCPGGMILQASEESYDLKQEIIKLGNYKYRDNLLFKANHDTVLKY